MSLQQVERADLSDAVTWKRRPSDLRGSGPRFPAGTLASPAPRENQAEGTEAGPALQWYLGNYSLCLLWAKIIASYLCIAV